MRDTPMYATMNTAYRLHRPLNVIMCIAGGWRVRIPRVDAESWAYAQIMHYLTACGLDSVAALQDARAAVQQHYTHGYTNGLRECVWRRAGEYADMWPQHRIATGDTRATKGVAGKLPVIELHGFDAAAISLIYVPMQNLGARGAEYARNILAEMGRRACETI